MSAAARCRSCACCGLPICENDRVSVEPVIELDAPVRYVSVLWNHSTFPRRDPNAKRG
jgi:hypothetical protein